MTGKELEYYIAGKNLTITEAASILEMSRQTLYAWIGKEVLKPKEEAHVLAAFKTYQEKINTSDQATQINNLRSFTPANFSNSEIKEIPITDFMETEYLSIEAQAGYLDSIDSGTMPKLDTMLTPAEFEKGNYLIVEIKGDSMDDGSKRSIVDGDRVLVKELDRVHWKNKLHFKQNLFVIMSNEGIVCKQIIAHDVANGLITCHSWNQFYKDYVISLESVYKLFYIKKMVERRIKF